MTNLQAYLETRLKAVLGNWHEEGIYVISFFLDTNEAYEYNGFSNVTFFSVSYNTEKDCPGAGALDEARWNYAFWRQNETPILDAYAAPEGMKILFDWYREKGYTNIGQEHAETAYDAKMRYIGRGPVGCYELLEQVTEAAARLQTSGFIQKTFGKQIPIILHDLTYTWYTIEATKKANPHGEAETFLAAMKEMGLLS